MPAYKVPKEIVFLDELPRDGNGKIQRAALAGLWCDVLETENAALDDDFFLCGGDSLRAVTLFLEINQTFSVDLRIDEMTHGATTIRALAGIIEAAPNTLAAPESPAADTSPATSTLVALHDSGPKIPLFTVPGVGGHAIGLVTLARLVGDERPVYGFQSKGLDGLAQPLDRLEDIAKDHIAALRAAHPTGPYYLFGACFGAVVAYEIAQQLTDQGEEVAHLFLLDPPEPDGHGDPAGKSAPVKWIGRQRHRLRRRFPLLGFVLNRLREDGHDLRSESWRGRLAYLGRKLRLLKGIVAAGDPFQGDRSEFHSQNVLQTNRRALHEYRPAPYAGPATLFLSTWRFAEFEKGHRQTWGRLLPETTTIVEAPGGDSGDVLVTPNVETLGRLMLDRLSV